MAVSAAANLSEVADQLRTAIWSAFLAWAFAPILCRAVRHGEVVLTIHDGQLRDVHVDLSTKNPSPPNRS